MLSGLTYHPLGLWTGTLLVLLILLYLFHLTGKVILSFTEFNVLKNKRYVPTFFNIVLGWLVMVSCYALTKTAAHTVLITLFIPAIALGLSFKKNQISLKDILAVPYGWWLCSSIVFVSVQCIQLMPLNGEFPLYIQNWDYTYYANFIDVLQQKGIENTHGPAVYYEQAVQGTTPYHYADLWTGALFSDLTGLRPVITLRLLVYSFFELLFFLGILAIWESYTTVTWKEVILSFVLMFVGGVFFEFYENIPFMGTARYISGNHLMGYGNMKYSPLYIAVAAAYLLFRFKYYKAAYVVWTCLPVLFISVLPAVTGGLILLGIYTVVVQKRKITMYYWLLPLVLYASLASFYYFTSSSDNSSVSSTRELLFSFASAYPLSEMMRILFQKFMICFLIFPAKYILSVLPWLLWIIWLWGWKDILHYFKTYSAIVILIVGSMLSGLVAFWLWYINVDAQQLFNNFMFPVINISIIVAVIRLSTSGKASLTGVILLALLGCWMLWSTVREIQHETIKYNTKYSASYLARVMNATANMKGKGGAFLAGINYYDTTSVFTFKPTQHIEGYYMSLTPAHTPFIISVFDMPMLTKAEGQVNQQRFLRSSYFYRYCEINKVKHQKEAIEAAMVDFIKKNELRYLIIGKGAEVPIRVQEICETCYTDDRSGEKFCVLKPE